MEAWAPLARGSLRILRVQVDCLTLAGRLDQCTALEVGGREGGSLLLFSFLANPRV